MADVTTTFAAKDESFAATVGKLQGRLTEFGGATDSFSQKAAGLASSFASFAGPIAAMGLAFLGAKGAVAAFTDAIKIGGELQDLSARTGETAGNLAVLQRAFANAGSSAESVGPVINKLQRAIVEAGEGNKTAVDTFDRLGISFEALKGMTPTEQLQKVASALQFVSNDSDRGALSMALLGKSGGEMIPLFRSLGSELDVARQQLGGFPSVIDATSAAFDTIGDNFTAIAAKTQEFATGLLSQLAPALVSITTQLASIDAAGLGAALSEWAAGLVKAADNALGFSSAIENIRAAISGIVAGNFSDGLSLMWVTMRNTALNAINVIVQNFTAGLMTLGDFMASMFSADGALVLTMKSAFTIAANVMREQLYSALADFMDAIGKMGMAETFRYQAETARQVVETNMNAVGTMFEEVGYQAAEAGKAMPDNFEANKDKLGIVFDLTDEFAEQQTLAAAIQTSLAAQAGSLELSRVAATGLNEAVAATAAAIASSALAGERLALSLNSSSLGAQPVAQAFGLASGSADRIAFSLSTTGAAAEKAAGWISQAADSSGAISIAGNQFQTSATAAAASISGAKGDAKIIADIISGPKSLTDAVSNVVNRANETAGRFDLAAAKGEGFAGMLDLQRGLDNAERRYQREEERANRQKMNGDDESSRKTMRAADESLAKRSYELTEKALAKETLEQEKRIAKEETSLEKQISGREQAEEKYSERIKAIGEEVKDKAYLGAEKLEDGASKGGQSLSDSGSAAADPIEGATSAFKGLVESFKSMVSTEKTLVECKKFLESLDKKLPQNALS
jgi:hypothetical protein